MPLQHPALDDSAHPAEAAVASGAGEYPLLTLPEQRQSRHSLSARASLQIDLRDSFDRRISLPRSVRASQETRRSQNPTPTPTASEFQFPAEEADRLTRLDKGKGKAIMTQENEDSRRSYSRDLERGLDAEPRPSNVSLGDGIGSAVSSSNSSIMGEEVEADAGEEWGPMHPCYPHLNPHVNVESLEYATTRIIRIRRDWLLRGDLAPTFSNIYPEILDPAGISEQDFRRIIEKINSVVVPAFNPYAPRNMVDAVLGLVTGWLWDDFGLTSIKSQLSGLEKWMEKWNLDMERPATTDAAAMTPRLISLRRTGYMTVMHFCPLYTFHLTLTAC